ncbi:MAG: hypothetical protein APF81_12560 [Desulfosporosinus sp. BRH_c37]|nr:MAG: hypothetical protein APF81_12560 [Desulfosporosinus sp. BRH_c37]
MLNFLIQGLVLSALFLVTFIIIEIVRVATGKEMFIDKLISYLQVVYRRSAPIANQEIDWQGSDLHFKGQVIKLSIEDIKRK